MEERMRSVSIAMGIGLLAIIFGILWAIYLETQHEKIHETLENRLKEESVSSVSLFVSSAFAHEKIKEDTHKNMEGMEEEKDAGSELKHSTMMHKNPLIDFAHRALTRGHLHAMGLGMLTLVISMVISYTKARDWIKTIASLFCAIGGFFYPISWIIIGYRIPSMGIEGAEESAMFIFGPSMALVLAGVLITAYYVFKGARR